MSTNQLGDKMFLFFKKKATTKKKLMPPAKFVVAKSLQRFILESECI